MHEFTSGTFAGFTFLQVAQDKVFPGCWKYALKNTAHPAYIKWYDDTFLANITKDTIVPGGTHKNSTIRELPEHYFRWCRQQTEKNKFHKRHYVTFIGNWAVQQASNKRRKEKKIVSNKTEQVRHITNTQRIPASSSTSRPTGTEITESISSTNSDLNTGSFHSCSSPASSLNGDKLGINIVVDVPEGNRKPKVEVAITYSNTSDQSAPYERERNNWWW